MKFGDVNKIDEIILELKEIVYPEAGNWVVQDLDNQIWIYTFTVSKFLTQNFLSEFPAIRMSLESATISTSSWSSSDLAVSIIISLKENW